MSGEVSPGSGIFFKPGGLPQVDAAVPAPAPAQTGAGAPAAAPIPAPPDHPRAIGKFRIARRLGTGGMGVVFEAEQERPRRTVALKVIRSSVLGPKAIRRFEFEAEVLARLQHPGIAQIFETGTFDEGEGPQPYFAMELVSGLPIDRFANEKSLDLDDRIALLLKICDAVQHAHQRGIIHRDLKPTNVIVDHSGLPKVLDFGVATTAAADISLTLSQSDFQYAAGTLPYLSPEQLTTEPHAPDVRGDVYALGVVAYELLTGRLPYEFRSGSLLEAAEIIRHQEPARPSTFNRLLRGDIEIILRKAIEKDPEVRYQSVSDLAADLGRFLRHEPLPPVRGPGLWYQVRRFTQRHKALAAGAAAVFLVLVAGITATSWQAVRATRSGRESRERFNELRRFANTVIFELEPAIRDLPGSTPARRLLIESALAYLDRLSRDAGSDPDLLADLAKGYHQLALIRGHPGMVNLGDAEGAYENLCRSIGLWEEVGALRNRDRGSTASLMAVRVDLSNFLLAHGRIQEAIEEDVLVQNHYWQLCEADPRDLESHWKLVNATVRLINSYQVRAGPGDQDTAIELCSRTTSLVVSTGPAKPTNSDEMKHLGNLLFALGTLNFCVERYDEALRFYELAATSLARVCTERPDDKATALTHADSYRYRGHVFRDRGDWNATVDQWIRAVELYREIATAYPNDYSAQQIVALAQSELGRAQVETGDLDAGLEEAREAVQRVEALRAAEPHSRHHLRTLIYLRHDHSQTLRATAARAELTPERRRSLLVEARDLLAWIVAAKEDALRQGALVPGDDRRFGDIDGELARCEAALAGPDAPAAAREPAIRDLTPRS